ncbi:MAG: hypothetical protein QM485_02665 [Flavobacteriaceae bacterium]
MPLILQQSIYVSMFFGELKFRKTKGGIKLRTLYDITAKIRVFIHLTEATVHDENAMDVIPNEAGLAISSIEAMLILNGSMKSLNLALFFCY